MLFRRVSSVIVITSGSPDRALSTGRMGGGIYVEDVLGRGDGRGSGSIIVGYGSRAGGEDSVEV